MEHREEMNCGGDLCKEMLELDKLLRASDSEEMMGGMVTHDTSLAKYGTRVVRVEDGRIIEKGKEILK